MPSHLSLQPLHPPAHHTAQQPYCPATVVPNHHATQPPQHPVTTLPRRHMQSSLERGPARGQQPVQRGLARISFEALPSWRNILCLFQPKRNVDWIKPALILVIKLDDTVFMELNFSDDKKKLSVQPNKDKRSSEAAREAISATNAPLKGSLSHPGMVSSVRLGHKVPFWVFFS